VAGALPVPPLQSGILVPTGSPIAISLDNPISSGTATVDDKFTFKATKDVLADGFVIVRKGAQGEGQVTAVEHAGGNGHPGKLGLQFNWIAAVDGSKIQLTDTPRTDEGEAKKGASSTATIATYLLLGPLGFFAHNLVKGRDITLDDKSKIIAYVDHSVRVSTQNQEVAQPGFAPAATSQVVPSVVVQGGTSGSGAGTLTHSNSPGAFALDNWSRVPQPSDDIRSVSLWRLAGASGEPAQSVTLIADSQASYADELAKIKKNFEDNHIVPSTDADLSCRGRQGHVVEFIFGTSGNETVVNRVLVPQATGLTTITYFRTKGLPYDAQVKKAIYGFCAAS
jgi:hypothetical protein